MSDREDLAAAIHETTNALTVILGWIDRARQAAGDNPAAIEALERASAYTRTARDGMRRSIGAEVPEPPPERAGDLAKRVAADLAIEARNARVVLVPSEERGAGDRRVRHPNRAWQILTNLVMNAIAVTPPDGAVRIHSEKAGDSILFRVSDEGPGVAPDHRPNIFDSGISKRRGGAGIGLKHCKQIAEEIGGELRLTDSEIGACFELCLPAVTSEPKPTPARPRATSTGLAGTRVLLLEDDAAVIELLELSLGARGAEVTTVHDANELHDKLSTGQYDVMLVDLSPLVSGRPDAGALGEVETRELDATLADARSANPDIEVVVISGSVTVQPRSDIIWVRKPFEPRELVQAIARGRGR